MLAKLTAKNQLTLPKAIVASMPTAQYFDVSVQDGNIVLAPVHIGQARAVREKLAELGVTEAHIADAVAWARR